MLRQILLIATLALMSLAAAEDIPLKDLYDIAFAFPNVTFCDRISGTKHWVDTECGNVRHITIKGKLKACETARKINSLLLNFSP